MAGPITLYKFMCSSVAGVKQITCSTANNLLVALKDYVVPNHLCLIEMVQSFSYCNDSF